ncbi:PREDICTED: fasciclin-like arabinogalactan protein 12 [Ipomoea nil]|uniref:fasciclin-like arabinogalactan protein 12 n=1 Tax=Ipomoea nil TaxID=35883 RepID=UPI0009010081|nr:PREDICTED: fasciclin-like arabinogalactan protein 12 [Ipomoea nil]
MKHFLVLLFLVALQCCSIRLAEAQAAGPAPSGPTNITRILEKAGQYTTFMRLLKITQVSDQINNQLNNSNQGLTVFAPTDNAFSGLKAGTLNSLTDQEKVELVQFHVLSSFFSMSQFQTASNPLKTQAGDSSGSFPLNVTTAGNQVNVTTGVVDSTVANTVYSDGQLAVYQVDKVLLPISLFGTPAPAAAPAPGKSKKKAKAADSPVSGEDASPTSSSGAVGGVDVHGMVAAAVVGVASIVFLL